MTATVVASVDVVLSMWDGTVADSRDPRLHVARALALGAVAGMRTQLPLALLAFAARSGCFAARAGPPLSLLRSPAVFPLLALSAAGEMVVDKLPIAPSRLAPGPLFGRLVFGGVAGAVVAQEADHSTVAGAALGAVGAALGAEAGYHTRVALGRVTGVPDPVWGAVEDVAALALGLLVVRGANRSTDDEAVSLAHPRAGG